jgi:hypothetical protein
MGRMLYWHLTIQEVSNTSYPVEKLIHWEIRCGFSEESYFSVFWFKVGVPYDKEQINGIAMYGVECSDEIVTALEDFLKNTLGGEIMRKSPRTFLSGARITLDNMFIANLATQLTKKFNAGSEIWLEFDDLTEDEEKQLFPSKALSIIK